MKYPNTKSGFAHLGALLLVIVILAVLGGGGYYIYHKKNPENNNARLASDDKKAETKITNYDECAKAEGSKVWGLDLRFCQTKDAQQFTRPLSQNHLTIKEWGVKIPLNSALADAYYRVDLDPSYVFISPGNLRDTSCGLENGGSGYLVRFTKDSINGESKRLYMSEFPDAVKLGAYYYGYGLNPAYQQCSSDTIVQNQAEAARDALKIALKDIQPAD